MFQALLAVAYALLFCLTFHYAVPKGPPVIVNETQLRQLRCGAGDCVGMILSACENLNSRDCDGGDCVAVPSDPSTPVCSISEQLENVKGSFPTCKDAEEGNEDGDEFDIACFARFVCSSNCEPDGMGGMVCAYNDSCPPYSEPEHMAPACVPAGDPCPLYIGSTELHRYRIIARANGL